ncbi:putative ORF-2 [hydrothermal vent metagenome]|uniref:Putative ORF-2 n=1 Tax=hydrothermal vent metagenome TaxID=652676 RepID=A0A3B0WNV4_9ZZZZ
MPEISRFLGIVIYMYFNEHNPPHFHAEYNEYKASISIKTLGLMEGKLPSKVMSLVVEWAQEHQNELFENWEEIKKTGKYHKIQPLV